MKMKFYLKVCNVGKEPEFVNVFDSKTGIRRRAEFHTYSDVEEAGRIIHMLRSDSAFLGTCIVKETQDA